MAQGVDVSRHQNTIDWRAARNDGIEFAYIKVTEGVGYVDPKVDHHLTGARAAGMFTGLYHFARPDTNAAHVDAEHFARETNLRQSAGPGNLPPCLDLEELKSGSLAGIDLVAWVSEFLATARRITGRRQFLLYVSAAFARDRLKGLSWLDNDCLVWVAHYGRDPGQPGWRDHRTVMHQYTSRGRISGYHGDIDLNTSMVELSTLTAGGTPPPPTAPPPTNRDDEPGGYVVVEGDTLSGIADRLAYSGGWRALYEDNRQVIGEDPHTIRPGMRLQLPRRSSNPNIRVHIVAAGENLSTIAQRYQIPGGWKALWDANRATVEDPDIIFAGQHLIIPG